MNYNDKRHLYSTAWIIGCKCCVSILEWNGSNDSSAFRVQGPYSVMWMPESDLERFCL